MHVRRLAVKISHANASYVDIFHKFLFVSHFLKTPRTPAAANYKTQFAKQCNTNDFQFPYLLDSGKMLRRVLVFKLFLVFKIFLVSRLEFDRLHIHECQNKSAHVYCLLRCCRYLSALRAEIMRM